jgi:hypothetical protein
MADKTRRNAYSPIANGYGDPDPDLAELIAALTETANAQDAPGLASGPTPGTGTAAIKAAFAELWQALDLAGSSHEPSHRTVAPARQKTATASDDFADIRAAFAELRQVLDLPAQSANDNLDGHAPDTSTPETTLRELDAAAAEAQACVRWFGQTHEWQRIRQVSDGTRTLISTIREAAGDYWAEVRQDIRVRGFARTVAARACRSIADAAGALARHLERSAQPTRASRGAHWLHQAATAFADALMSYVIPGSNERMRDVERLVSDLQRRPEDQLGPSDKRQQDRRTSVSSSTRVARASFPRTLPPAAQIPERDTGRRTACTATGRHRRRSPSR